MSDGIVPKIGDWIVLTPNYPAAVASGPVSKLTAQRAYHPDRWGGSREQFSDFTAIRFCGAEAVCKSLAEKIVSSSALKKQDERDAQLRHNKRIEDAIQKASAT